MWFIWIATYPPFGVFCSWETKGNFSNIQGITGHLKKICGKDITCLRSLLKMDLSLNFWLVETAFLHSLFVHQSSFTQQKCASPYYVPDTCWRYDEPDSLCFHRDFVLSDSEVFCFIRCMYAWQPASCQSPDGFEVRFVAWFTELQLLTQGPFFIAF